MKFDSNLIPGFAEMTAEQRVEALLNFEIEPPKVDESEETKRLKAALSRANSEASEWKKALREKQTEAERAEAERAEREKAVEDELRMLRRDKTVSGYVASCLALGYGKDLAQRAAEAMADGDAAKIMECQQEFLEAKTKELEAEALGKQPPLTPGKPPEADKSEDDKLSETMMKYAGL